MPCSRHPVLKCRLDRAECRDPVVQPVEPLPDGGGPLVRRISLAPQFAVVVYQPTGQAFIRIDSPGSFMFMFPMCLKIGRSHADPGCGPGCGRRMFDGSSRCDPSCPAFFAVQPFMSGALRGAGALFPYTSESGHASARIRNEGAKTVRYLFRIRVAAR